MPKIVLYGEVFTLSQSIRLDTLQMLLPPPVATRCWLVRYTEARAPTVAARVMPSAGFRSTATATTSTVRRMPAIRAVPVVEPADSAA